ncbi:MAG: hypothetical protein ACRCXT_14215 [Paraclostridium sp.]
MDTDILIDMVKYNFIKPKKLEIGFAYKNKIIVDIHLQKRALKMWLNTTFGSLEDNRNTINKHIVVKTTY